MNLKVAGVCCCIMTVTTGCQAEPVADVFVESPHIRVGVNTRWGGAITYVATPNGPNIINSADLGRQIQQSYYSGPPNYQRAGKEKSPHWASFPWNPIQTGDAYHNGSKVLEHRVQNGELYVKTIPMLWPMNNDPGECIMETWIKPLPGGAKFRYRARLTNQRSDTTQYHGSAQEVPAVYTNGPWHRLTAYIGDQPFTGGTVSEIRNDHREGWPWVNYLPTEGWAALLNDQGTGIGVCVPHAMEFHGGFSGRRGEGGEKSGNTGYMSPITTEILDHNIVYEYTCVFVVGDVDAIRTEARRYAQKGLPAWDLSTARHGWHYANGKDAGWPLEGRGLTVIANKPGDPVRVIGPFTFWRSETAGTLRLRVTSRTAGEIKVFWRGMPPQAASTRPSQWTAWRNTWWEPNRSVTVPLRAGANQWITVKLAGQPGYEGGLTGLALDVPDGLSIHAIRLAK